MPISSRSIPCLWFDSNAEDAARFYVGIFPNSKVGQIARYTRAGHDVHKRPAGSVMTVAFELEGQPFTALNGGPAFTFNEAISLQVYCETQEEIDGYGEAGGRRRSGRSSVAGSRTSTVCRGRSCRGG